MTEQLEITLTKVIDKFFTLGEKPELSAREQELIKIMKDNQNSGNLTTVFGNLIEESVRGKYTDEEVLGVAMTYLVYLIKKSNEDMMFPDISTLPSLESVIRIQKMSDKFLDENKDDLSDIGRKYRDFCIKHNLKGTEMILTWGLINFTVGQNIK